MFSVLVDEEWFERHWYSSDAPIKRQWPPNKLMRYLVCLLLVVGTVVAVSHTARERPAGNQSSGTAIRLM